MTMNGTLTRQDELANRELSIDELDAVAAGAKPLWITEYQTAAGLIVENGPRPSSPFLKIV
jgi:hypothetical protein